MNKNNEHHHKTAIICMPFFRIEYPSIQLGLLKAIAEQEGHFVDTYHLNLDLLKYFTVDEILDLCTLCPDQAAEWLFSVVTFGESVPADENQFFDAYPQVRQWFNNKLGWDEEKIHRIRHETLPAFIEDCLTMYDWNVYKVIGFSTTFHQTVASLAMARRLKEIHPHIHIIFGGANMSQPVGIELLKSFPFIDFGVVGHADMSFPYILENLYKDKIPSQLPGIIYRDDKQKPVVNDLPEANTDLDKLPVPNYDEYFEKLNLLDLQLSNRLIALISMETSRGCWYGEKNPCNFCGSNMHYLKFNSKSVQKVYQELSSLSKSYNSIFFIMTDNILHFKNFVPLFLKLADMNRPFHFYWEVRSELNRQQLWLLSEAGVTHVEPGIESLNTHILKLMNKGITMLKNIRFLKWACFYGIDPLYSILHGFPGETQEDYDDQIQILRLLTHLKPPDSIRRLKLDRFSPFYINFKEDKNNWRRPYLGYNYIYPKYVNKEDIGFIFEHHYEDTLPDDAIEETKSIVKEWAKTYFSKNRDVLFYRWDGFEIEILDRRGAEPHRYHRLKKAEAMVFESISDTMRTPQEIKQHLMKFYDITLNERNILLHLMNLTSLGLVVSEDNQYFNLAFPDTRQLYYFKKYDK